MKSAPPADRVDGLAGQRQRLDRRGEREAALEQDLVEQIVRGAALAHVVDVQLELLLAAPARRAGPRRSTA